MGLGISMTNQGEEINWFDSEELDFPSLKNTFENEGDIYSKRLREMLDFSEELMMKSEGK